MTGPQHALVRQMEELVAREQALLSAGDYSTLEALVETKASLAEAIRERKDELSIGDAETLRRFGAKSAAHLSATAEGMRSAIDRLTILQSGPPKLRTYTASGAKISRDPAAPLHDKRA